MHLSTTASVEPQHMIILRHSHLSNNHLRSMTHEDLGHRILSLDVDVAVVYRRVSLREAVTQGRADQAKRKMKITTELMVLLDEMTDSHSRQ